MAIYFPFAFEPRTGGDFVNLEHLQALRRLGVDARIFYLGKRPEDVLAFADIPLMHNDSEFRIYHQDIMILPECLPGLFGQFKDEQAKFAKVRAVMHNQNPFYNIICGQSIHDFNQHLLERIIVPSEYAERRLKEMGIQKPIDVIKPCIPAIFAPQEKSRQPIRIAFSSRKRQLELDIIKFYFNSYYQGNYPLEFVNLLNMPREQVAQIMAQSAIFVSLAERESLGLMALEAMASGCHVVGFAGHTGGYCEYFTPENGDWIAEGDYANFARKLIDAIELFASGAPNPKVQAGMAMIEKYFRQAQFDQQIKAVYGAILQEPLLDSDVGR